MHTYASDTPELRELLSDLEYLWDQVKDIQPSSSSSSDSVAMPPIASTPHYLPVSSRSARSVDRESSVDQTPSEGGTAALTAANLMTYNQQQQQQQQNVRVTSSSRPQRVPRPGSFAGSYSSAGKHNHKKYQGSSKRSSKYHDNPIPGINPPPLYSAQSYISGGESVNSRAAETVNTAAATGLPPTTPNQKSHWRQYPGSASSLTKKDHIPTRLDIKLKKQGRNLPYFTESNDVEDQEFFDAREAANSIRNAAATNSARLTDDPLIISTGSKIIDETNELTRWRRDVNWALETINEEIMAIRQRYGTNKNLEDSFLSSKLSSQDSQDPTRLNHKYPNQDDKMQISSSSENSEHSELYKNSLLYSAILKARQLLVWIGIGKTDTRQPPRRDTSHNPLFHHPHSRFIPKDGHFLHAPGHSPLASPPQHTWRSGLVRIFATVFAIVQRAVVDLVVLYLLAFLFAKGISKFPQVVGSNKFHLQSAVSVWDTAFKRLLLGQLVKKAKSDGSQPSLKNN